MTRTQLERRVRLLSLYAVGTAPLLAVLVFGAFAQDDDRRDVRRFQEVSAERINVVAPDGTNRIVLSNEERLPPPVLQGDTMRGRSIAPAGITFHDEDGDERGGVGVSEEPGRGEQVALFFDYRNSEAIGVAKAETEDGDHYRSSLSLYDRQPLDADIREIGSVGTRRVAVSNEDGTARIVLEDTEGRQRIRLEVTRDDEARIEILDDEGEVVHRMPPE